MLLLLAIAGGCATKHPSDAYPSSSTQGVTLVRMAYVTDVRDVTMNDNRSSGAGAVIGTIIGELVGSGMGGGNGRTAASIGGAFIGHMAGNQIEKNTDTTTKTALTVRFDNGEYRTYQVAHDASFRIGDLVNVSSSPGKVSITH